jgi:hypothetical protein
VPGATTNSQWRIGVWSASIKATMPSGTSWDTVGSPDPVVCSSPASAANWDCTSEQPDTFMPSWQSVLPTAYLWPDLATSDVGVFDNDVAGRETIDRFQYDLRCPWASYPCSFVINRSAQPTSGLNSIILYAEPL